MTSCSKIFKCVGAQKIIFTIFVFRFFAVFDVCKQKRSLFHSQNILGKRAEVSQRNIK